MLSAWGFAAHAQPSWPPAGWQEQLLGSDQGSWCSVHVGAAMRARLPRQAAGWQAELLGPHKGCPAAGTTPQPLQGETPKVQGAQLRPHPRTMSDRPHGAQGIPCAAFLPLTRPSTRTNTPPALTPCARRTSPAAACWSWIAQQPWVWTCPSSATSSSWSPVCPPGQRCARPATPLPGCALHATAAGRSAAGVAAPGFNSRSHATASCAAVPGQGAPHLDGCSRPVSAAWGCQTPRACTVPQGAAGTVLQTVWL